MTYTRSLPMVSPETKPFWDGCREGKLIVQRCRDCGRFQSYYRAFCCHCWSKDVEDHVSSGRGTVWSFTVTHINKTPGWEDHTPYTLAAVEVEEGVKYMTNIVNCSMADVHIGMPVQVTFVAATDEITIPYFEPVRESAGAD